MQTGSRCPFSVPSQPFILVRRTENFWFKLRILENSPGMMLYNDSALFVHLSYSTSGLVAIHNPYN